MYADDTILYCNISQNIGEEVINAELSKICEWLGANKLSLNILRLEEFYSYTEKIQQKRTRKTKQNKGKLCTANNYIQ